MPLDRALRAAGFWVARKQKEQKMADLPADCLSTDLPFTFVGLNVFGPWCVTSRRMRGAAGHHGMEFNMYFFTISQRIDTTF